MTDKELEETRARIVMATAPGAWAGMGDRDAKRLLDEVDLLRAECEQLKAESERAEAWKAAAEELAMYRWLPDEYRDKALPLLVAARALDPVEPKPVPVPKCTRCGGCTRAGCTCCFCPAEPEEDQCQTSTPT